MRCLIPVSMVFHSSLGIIRGIKSNGNNLSTPSFSSVYTLYVHAQLRYDTRFFSNVDYVDYEYYSVLFVYHLVYKMIRACKKIMRINSQQVYIVFYQLDALHTLSGAPVELGTIRPEIPAPPVYDEFHCPFSHVFKWLLFSPIPHALADVCWWVMVTVFCQPAWSDESGKLADLNVDDIYECDEVCTTKSKWFVSNFDLITCCSILQCCATPSPARSKGFVCTGQATGHRNDQVWWCTCVHAITQRKSNQSAL